MIPRAITRELAKLVRSRDTWRRRALDRTADGGPERRSQIEARGLAVRELLFAIAVEGTSKLSRGGQGCLSRAIEALRPDVYAAWGEEGGDAAAAGAVMRRFFPTADGLADEAREDGEG